MLESVKNKTKIFIDKDYYIFWTPEACGKSEVRLIDGKRCEEAGSFNPFGMFQAKPQTLETIQSRSRRDFLKMFLALMSPHLPVLSLER